MRYKLFCTSCIVAVAVIGAAPAYANPVGHGNMCGSPDSANPASEAPGNSATSPGSTHNEPGTRVNPEKQSARHPSGDDVSTRARF
jgi:hypothetical protein